MAFDRSQVNPEVVKNWLDYVHYIQEITGLGLSEAMQLSLVISMHRVSCSMEKAADYSEKQLEAKKASDLAYEARVEEKARLDNEWYDNSREIQEMQKRLLKKHEDEFNDGDDWKAP